MADSIQMIRMPQDVKELLLGTLSLNMSGVPGTGQGADFRLEEVNKLIQQWLPNIPSANDWKWASVNFDKLSQFRSHIFIEMGIKDPNLKQILKKPQNIDE